MKVEFKKLYADTQLPKKANPSDAGFDLYAHATYDGFDFSEGYQLSPNESILVRCGFAMALPIGYEAQIRSRSGLALKNGICVLNSPGTIDTGYRNEIGVILFNTSKNTFMFKPGDRIAQMVIQKLPDVETVEVDELSKPTDRGMGGFGSTGI